MREVTMTTGMIQTSMVVITRSILLRLALAVAIVFCFSLASRAGGPEYVAGPSFFDPTVTGQPIVWPQGQITYYTDQGNLSPILPNTSANSFVASAFSVWTSVSTAAVSATSGGQLAEDVNGSNVYVNSDGTITMPADIQSSATATPVGVVYDYDGSVTDALIGAGAGQSSMCFYNAVFGGDDNFGSFATFQHALIVINGQCAQQSSQLTDVEYRLLRVIGQVLGVGWSQVNPNVITGSPAPTSADYAGFPLMHYTDPWGCVPITLCYPNPLALAMDDMASLSRLYPVTAQNQSNFPGKPIFSATTARIHGSVWFTDPDGNATQAMQGVNVVARWIDPSTGLPSRQYAASSVSGSLFTGNAGNLVTGFYDMLGNPYTDWGSNNQTVEGFFDLSGLAPPNGNSAQYQLTVEAIDSTWAAEVGPYSPGPVAPSGTVQPITVTVPPGNDVEQDALMTGSGQPISQAAQSWTSPISMPSGGDWISTLNGYGDVAYILLPAQANRTLSVAVTALNESGNPSQSKAQPVIGMWAASDPPGTAAPAYTPSAFNQTVFGMTRLDAQVGTASNFLIAISDVRGDGRPDYRYHAHVLYADTVSPARLSVAGGAVTVQGTGFASGQATSIGDATAAHLSVSAGQMILTAPAYPDGTQNLTISDPVTGASTTVTGAVTYGAAATDNLVLLYGLNPSTPVGVQAANPVRVRVVAADGVTPVSGATIVWSASNNVQLSACSGAYTCSVLSDQSGNSSTWLTPTTTGVSTITATLAPGAYASSPSVAATLNAIESSSDIGVTAPYLWISQGATVSLPLIARVLSNGVPRNNVQVNFTIVNGSGTLSASSAQTSSTGYATVNLSLTQIASLVQISACVAPGNAPCGMFYVNAVPLSQQNLQPISGAGQVSTGQAFTPIFVRITDSSSPPNPVVAAPVAFQTTVLRESGTSSDGGNPVMPVILAVSQSNVTTDVNGLASVLPSAGSFSPPLDVDVSITAGNGAALEDVLAVYPAPANDDATGKIMSPTVRPLTWQKSSDDSSNR